MVKPKGRPWPPGRRPSASREDWRKDAWFAKNRQETADKLRQIRKALKKGELDKLAEEIEKLETAKKIRKKAYKVKATDNNDDLPFSERKDVIEDARRKEAKRNELQTGEPY